MVGASYAPTYLIVIILEFGMRDSAVTFDERILTDEIFPYNYPRTIADIINESAFIGSRNTLKLIRPWFADIGEEEVLLKSGLQLLPKIPLEPFSVGLAMSLVEETSEVVISDYNLKLLMTDVVKRDFSEDAFLIQKAIDHIYLETSTSFRDLEELVLANAYSHITRVLSVGGQTYVYFNDEDERLVAYHEMEEEHATGGSTRFISPRKQALAIGNFVPWARDIELVFPRYRLDGHAKRRGYCETE